MGLFDTYFVFTRTLRRIYEFGLPFVRAYPKDPLFQYLSYFFTRLFGLNEPLYLILFSAPFIIAASLLIYKYSKNIYLSFILFASTQMFTITFTLMRQINAMALLIFAFFALMKNKYLLFFSLVVTATFIHEISLLFLIVPLLFKFINVPLITVSFPIIGILLGTVFTPLIRFVIELIVGANSRFDHMINARQSNNMTMFFIFTIICMVAIYFSKKTSDVLLKKSTILSSFSLLFFPLTAINREFARIAYFFIPFLLISYPNALNYIEEEKPKIIIQALSAVVLMVYFLFFLIHTTGLYPYATFWQIFRGTFRLPN